MTKNETTVEIGLDYYIELLETKIKKLGIQVEQANQINLKEYIRMNRRVPYKPWIKRTDSELTLMFYSNHIQEFMQMRWTAGGTAFSLMSDLKDELEIFNKSPDQIRLPKTVTVTVEKLGKLLEEKS
jgi:hypothetical protein